MFGGCFDEVEEVPEAPKVDQLKESDEKVPILRQKIVQGYRVFKETQNIDRYIKSL